MIIKVGKFYVNESQLTHCVPVEDGLILYFSSTDFNKSATGNPSLKLEGEEAEMLRWWLDCSSVDLTKEMRSK